jgi:DNA polymerase III subunit beta
MQQKETTMQHQTKIKPSTAIQAQVDRKALGAALAIVNKVVERKNTPLILSNVCLFPTFQCLSLCATDLDLQVDVTIPESGVDSRMGTTVPAHLLQDLVTKASATDSVMLTMEEGHLALDAGRFKSRLQTITADDFPRFETDWKEAITFGIPGSQLWNALDGVRGAMSSEETRYYLKGIFMHVRHASLRFVATNGHKLYCQDVPLPKGLRDLPPNVIIPRKTVDFLHWLMSGKKCPVLVEVKVTAQRLQFSFEGITVTSKIIDGEYPDYQRVVPAGNNKHVALNGEQLVKDIAAVTVISSERGRAVKLTLRNNLASLTVKNPDAGESSIDMKCDYECGDVDIGFNAKYLADIIQQASPDGKDVVIKLHDHGSPTIFTGSQAGWFGVLMPMRV